MKKRSGKNFIRFFYHFLVVLVMAMPMLSGLVRVIYVQSNMNAKDSYYGETINNEIATGVSFNDLEFGSIYSFESTNRVPSVAEANSTIIKISLISLNSTSLVAYNNPSFDLLDCDFLRLRNYNNEFILFEFGKYGIGDAFYYVNSAFRFTFIFEGYDVTTSIVSLLPNFIYTTYNNYSYLDNAFDYSIWKTMQDFTFHTDFRFTDIANGMLMTFDNNNLYIQYINFYINWVLTTAVISFAPYVLLTFYHLAIGLLDKFMKKGDEL